MSAPDPAAVVREACEAMDAALVRAEDCDLSEFDEQYDRLRAALDRLRGLRVVEGWYLESPAQFTPAQMGEPDDHDGPAALLLPPEGS